MYNEYVSTAANPLSWRTYSRIFNQELNLGFFTPRKIHVVLCEAHKNFTKTSEETEQKQAEYEQHIKSKDRAREEMKRDGERAKLDPSTGTFSLSLQQVLTTPYGNVSTLYYKRKFSSYNHDHGNQ